MTTSEQAEDRIQSRSSVPVIGHVDVLVVGGGPAGMAAALCAARCGANTLIVERYGYLGGMITGANVVWVLGVGDGYRPIARGVTQDIRDRLEQVGGVNVPNKCGDYAVDREACKWQAAEMLREAGAAIRLHTMACDPILEDGAVRGVFIESKNGREAIRAKVVVDCSADGDIAFRAGCGFDNQTHDISLTLRVDGIDKEEVDAFRREQPERYAEVEAEAKRLNGGRMVNQVRHVKGLDAADATDLTRAEIEIRDDLFKALLYLRKNMPGWEKAAVRETLPQLGVRQSRRIHCGYTITDADLRQSRHFDDAIARLGAYLQGYMLYDPAGLHYDIPYRSLTPNGMDGLLVAGRSISSDYLANNTLRLIVPCFATGQAAGVAAALAARHGVEPRAVSITELRSALLEQDVYLGTPEQQASLKPIAPADAPLDAMDGGA